ncbi:WW domain-binding protein 4 [Arctopsyche grandis]|uniref:WW domain-binding protein 4 n=1 Tax=Arctopsyche grandis TaxID=121162 RepID=UPI00406D9025
MADYWKSNARKYCDFCKCWIADNKVSVSLHEDGKRHKENVAKKISAINKKSAVDRKIQNKIDADMAKMEKGAMAAYLKDIESNADLTSQIINEKLAEANKIRHTISVNKNPSAGSSVDQTPPGTKKKIWQEAKSIKGHTYYWNTETNDTVWEPPAEGYVSLAELVVKKDPKAKPNHKPPKPSKKFKGNANHNKFKSKDGALPKTETFGPLPRGGDPYGSWKAVVPIAEVDLQLPEQRYAPVVAPVIKIPTERQFQQKQITSLEDESTETNFKKRKINSNAKRNTRQRLDDD